MPEYSGPGVYVEEISSGKAIQGVGTRTAGFVGMTQHVIGNETDNDALLNKPTRVTSWEQFAGIYGRHEKDKAPHLPPAIQGFFANGGSYCYVVRVKEGATDADYIGSGNGPGNRTGLQSLIDVDDVNIVCIPGVTSVTVQRAMIAHCESMKHRVCILDSIKDATSAAINAQRQDVGSPKGMAALYYPWIEAALEPAGNSNPAQELVAPSGHIAGIYARVDAEKGVHRAPANEIIRGASGLKVELTAQQQEALNPQGINCIRALPGRGIRVWGARTTSDDPQWKYVNVRRLLIFLEESIEKGTRWAVFEPNGETLWRKVAATVSDFLLGVWRNGALMGSKPEKAFFVKCDRTTMTQDDIDNGRLVCLIGVAPLKPAEFVIFRIGQCAGGRAMPQ
jgi:phage tail sheath protein FI